MEERIARLISRLTLKKALLEASDPGHQAIRTALIICDGGTKGASGGGAVHALHLLGLGDVFDVVTGVSTGAFIGAKFLAGPAQTRDGAAIYYQELPGRFIQYARRPIVDIDYLVDLFREGPKALDVPGVLQHRSKFLVGVTDLATCTQELIDFKGCTDPILSLHASAAIPGLYNKTVFLEGRLCVDGGINGLPAREIVRRHNPTDVLVIANTPEGQDGKSANPLESLLRPILMRHVPFGLHEPLRNRHHTWNSELEYLRSRTHINLAVVWGTPGVATLTRNAKRLRAAAEETARRVLAMFCRHDLEPDLP